MFSCLCCRAIVLLPNRIVTAGIIIRGNYICVPNYVCVSVWGRGRGRWRFHSAFGHLKRSVYAGCRGVATILPLRSKSHNCWLRPSLLFSHHFLAVTPCQCYSTVNQHFSVYFTSSCTYA